MKLGVSTWSLLGEDLIDAVRIVGDSGVQYIELWGEIPHAYPDWADTKALKDALSNYNMTITVHAPFTDLNMATPFDPVRGAVERTLASFVSYSERLGARVVTLHPGSVHNEAMVPKSLQNVADMLRSLLRVAAGRIVLSVENQSMGRSRYHHPVGNTVDSIKNLVSLAEGVSFTLDTGHAHSSGIDPSMFSRELGSKMKEIHLSDNHGQSDEHRIPGEGNANLNGVLKGLSDDFLVCLELDPHYYTKEKVMAFVSSSLRSP